MSAKRYTEEFKIEAVKQVTERGHRLSEVATRLTKKAKGPIEDRAKANGCGDRI